MMCTWPNDAKIKTVTYHCEKAGKKEPIWVLQADNDNFKDEKYLGVSTNIESLSKFKTESKNHSIKLINVKADDSGKYCCAVQFESENVTKTSPFKSLQVYGKSFSSI